MVGNIKLKTQRLKSQLGKKMAKRIKLQNKSGDLIEVWDDQSEHLKNAGWIDPTQKKSKTKPKSFNTEEGEE